MPSDIRSFFGGKPSTTSASASPPKSKPKPQESKSRGRSRKVIEDDEDDSDDVAEVVTSKKSTPRKGKKADPKPAPVELEETTASEYFGKGTKPKRSEAAVKSKTKAEEKVNGAGNAATPEKKGVNGTRSARSSARKTKGPASYVELDGDDFPDDDLEDGDVGVDVRVEVKKDAAADDADDLPQLPKRQAVGRSREIKDEDEDAFEQDGDVDMKDTHDDDDFVVPDEDEEIVTDKPAKKTPAKTGSKRKSEELLDEDDDDLLVEEVKPAAKKRAKAAPTAKSPAASKKKEDPQDSAEISAIFASIPTIKAPSPPPKADDPEGGKPKFQFGQHPNSAAPANALDSSDFPTGEPNCLSGLTFVFTGQLSRLGREQGQSLVKQYGGKVTGAPSKRTSYVVLGDDAGPKKLETIKREGLKVINEDGLFELIRRLPADGGSSVAAEKNAKKRADEEAAVQKAAEEIDRVEREAAKAREKAAKASASASPVKGKSINATTNAATAGSGPAAKGKQSAAGPDTRLWTVRYAPTQLTQICGNKAPVEKLQRWLRAFPKNQRTKFKLPGPDASGTFRAVMIHGPPGIGKTTAAHLVAKLEGYDVVESNASDARSKKLVEAGMKGVLSTTSLMGYFGSATGGGEVEASKKKLVLIMDEVDGMSAGDRGGVGALAAVAKKTRIPLILICNERKQPKMRPFDFVTFDLPFRRPTVDQIRSRIMTIAFREGMKMEGNVINRLIEGSGSDIRQVVNMISTAKLDVTAATAAGEEKRNLSFEESKDMSKAWEKHIVLKPWDMVAKILGGGLFNPAAKSTLNDKQELYFNDHEFAPLMLQENYLGTQPVRSNQFNDNPRMKKLALLDLASKAADAISEGDLVDLSLIHISEPTRPY